MASLGAQFCFNHPVREAVGRCPECGRTYCRECITDHDGRILCAACIQQLAGSREEKKGQLVRWLRVGVIPARVAFGLFVAWVFFYSIGRMLVAIPSEFHSGAVWERAGETDPIE